MPLLSISLVVTVNYAEKLHKWLSISEIGTKSLNKQYYKTLLFTGKIRPVYSYNIKEYENV